MSMTPESGASRKGTEVEIEREETSVGIAITSITSITKTKEHSGG
jgi:hypothetical protein